MKTWLLLSVLLTCAPIALAASEQLSLQVETAPLVSPAKRVFAAELSRTTKKYVVTRMVRVKNSGELEVKIPVFRAPNEANALSSMSDEEHKYVYCFVMDKSVTGEVLVSPQVVLTLRPGESTYLAAIYTPANAGESLPQLCVEYSVAKEFATRYGTWTGTLFCRMDTIDVKAPVSIRPNKSLQPTPTAVTPPAAQEIVPAVGVAEH
jgi:hypothetical protein